jgi:2-amino-4-hydroxy-6-hydroxymethyldihydropteridine diphosphokinase
LSTLSACGLQHTTAFVAFGGNLGDVAAAFAAARQALHTQAGRIVASSRLYVTAPMQATGAVSGGPAQPRYLNAVVRLETPLAPHALLRLLLQLEQQAGRRRTVRWAPRPLDLDLLIYGSQQHACAKLTLPHPGLAVRTFVLQPLCDVAADWPIPPKSTTPRQLRAALVHPWTGIWQVRNHW